MKRELIEGLPSHQQHCRGVKASDVQRERGTTLVEYSLVVALIVVASLGALQFLKDKGEEQTLNEVDCISDRPAPTSCQPPAIVTTTTTSTPDPPPCEIDCIEEGEEPSAAGTSTVEPVVPGYDPADPASSPTGSFHGPGGTWFAQMTLSITDSSEGVAVEGATIQVAWTVDGMTTHLSCVTGSSGQCSVSFTPPFATSTSVVGAITSITSSSHTVEPPSPALMTFAKPL